MTAPRIGVTAGGESVDLVVEALIGSNLAAIANAGGGKSGLIRVILERTQGAIQQIVLDIEDNYATLREKGEYVILGGEDADGPAPIAGARQLALATLEHGFDLIVQLNDLGLASADYVAEFVSGMMSAPKALWHPVLVVIDEAQFVVSGELPTAANAPVKDLAFRGRKRGFTLLLASLRLAKAIDPAIRGMINNWLIGRSATALDRKAMAEQLGFEPADGRRLLKAVEVRDFFALGPALTREPTLFRVDDAETTIVERGQQKPPVAPAPEKLRDLLATLAPSPTVSAGDPSIPADAAASEMLLERDRRIAELEATFRNDTTRILELEELLAAKDQQLRRHRRLSCEAHDILNRLVTDPDRIEGQANEAPAVVADVGEGNAQGLGVPSPQSSQGSPDAAISLKGGGRGAAGGGRSATPPTPAANKKQARNLDAGTSTALNAAAVQMAEILKAMAPAQFTWAELALVCGLKPNSGYIRAARNALLDGYVTVDGAVVRASERLLEDAAIDEAHWPSVEELVAIWARKLKSPGGEILEDLAKHGDSTADQIGTRLGKSSTSGYFRGGIKDLLAAGLATRSGKTLGLVDFMREDG